MKSTLRLLSLGLVLLALSGLAQSNNDYTTNRPGVVVVPGAASNTNAPSSIPWNAPPSSGYTYPIIDSSGRVVWPTNFAQANGLTGGGTNSGSFGTTNIGLPANGIYLSPRGYDATAAVGDARLWARTLTNAIALLQRACPSNGCIYLFPGETNIVDNGANVYFVSNRFTLWGQGGTLRHVSNPALTATAILQAAPGSEVEIHDTFMVVSNSYPALLDWCPFYNYGARKLSFYNCTLNGNLDSFQNKGYGGRTNCTFYAQNTIFCGADDTFKTGWAADGTNTTLYFNACQFIANTNLGPAGAGIQNGPTCGAANWTFLNCDCITTTEPQQWAMKIWSGAHATIIGGRLYSDVGTNLVVAGATTVVDIYGSPTDPAGVTWDGLATINWHPAGTIPTNVPAVGQMLYSGAAGAYWGDPPAGASTNSPQNISPGGGARNTFSRLWNRTNLTIAMIGDLANPWQDDIYMSLAKFMPRHGFVGQDTSIKGGNFAYANDSGSGHSIHDADWPASHWHLVNGESVTWASDQTSSGYSASSIGVLYLQNATNGTFALQTNRANGTWGTIATINAASGSGVGFASYSLPFYSDYGWKIVSTGNNVIYTPMLRSTNGPSLTFADFSASNDDYFQRWGTMASNDFYTAWSAIAPDLILWQSQDTTASVTNYLATLVNRWRAACSNADIVFLTPTPVADGSYIGLPDNPDNQRQALLSYGQHLGIMVYDAWAYYRPFVMGITNYPLLAAGGFFSDSTHMTTMGKAAMSQGLLPFIGLDPSSVLACGYGLGYPNATYTTDGYQRLVTPGDIWCQGSIVQVQTSGGGTFGGYDPVAGYAWSIGDSGGAMKFGDTWGSSSYLTLSNIAGQIKVSTPAGFTTPNLLGDPNSPYALNGTNCQIANVFMLVSGSPPSSAPVAGAAMLWNSNSFIYLLQSSSGSTAWAATNKIGK